MTLMAYMDENDKGTAIEFADAVIKYHIPDYNNMYLAEEEYIHAREKLAEIAEHIQVYLKYNQFRTMYGRKSGSCEEVGDERSLCV